MPRDRVTKQALLEYVRKRAAYRAAQAEEWVVPPRTQTQQQLDHIETRSFLLDLYHDWRRKGLAR